MKDIVNFIYEKADDRNFEVPVKDLYKILLKASKQSRKEWLENRKSSASYWKDVEGENSYYWQNYLEEEKMFNINCDEEKISDDGCKLLALRMQFGEKWGGGDNEDFSKYCEKCGHKIKDIFESNIDAVCKVLRTYEYENGKKWYEIKFTLGTTNFEIGFIGTVKELNKYKI